MFEEKSWGFFVLPKNVFFEVFKNNEIYIKNGFKDVEDEYVFMLVFVPYENKNKIDEATIAFEYYHYNEEEQYRFGFSGYDLANKMLKDKFMNKEIYTRQLGYNLTSFYMKNLKVAMEIATYLNDEYKKKFPLMPFNKEEKLPSYKDFIKAFENNNSNEEWDVFSANNRKYITYNQMVFMDITNLSWSDNDAKFITMMLREAYFSGYNQAMIDNEDDKF